MCGVPEPIREFGILVMKYLVNQQFDFVDAEVKKFQKKGYVIYSRVFSKEEYESSRFKKNSDEAMKKAKEASKDAQYLGILLFFPSITKFSTPNKIWWTLYDKICWVLIDSSIDFNDGSCLNTTVLNWTGKKCEDTNLYVMVFYSK